MPPLAPALHRLASRSGLSAVARRSAARSGRLLASAGLVVGLTAATGSGYAVMSSSDESADSGAAVPNVWAAELA